jgi:predicted nucleic acid-binding protein
MVGYVVDTTLYVEAIRTDEGNDALARFQRRFAPLLFQHSTVAQEILAGAADEMAYREYHEDWIEPFEKLGRLITPTHSAWMRAALIMTRLVERRDRSPSGFSRGFLNDCLIAATARDQGFTLVTNNARDFDLIGRVEPALRYVPPWPTE